MALLLKHVTIESILTHSCDSLSQRFPADGSRGVNYSS